MEFNTSAERINAVLDYAKGYDDVILAGLIMLGMTDEEFAVMQETTDPEVANATIDATADRLKAYGIKDE